MERRSILKHLAAVGTISGIGGCLSSTSTNLADNPTTTNSSSDECASVWKNTDRTICKEQESNRAPRLSLNPESEIFTVITGDHSVETLGLTLQNHTDQQVIVDPSEWRILRQVDDEWSESARGEGTAESVAISPGKSHEWSLSLTPHPTPRTEETTFITADLHEGTYLFAVLGMIGDGNQTQRIECHTQFELVKRLATESPSKK